MRITICEFPDEAARKDAAWSGIVGFLEGPGTELLVLPEMPFCAWQMFTSRSIDNEAWRAALAAHDAMIARFGELNADAVIASRPIERDGMRFNEGFCWTRGEGYRAVRTKRYLPDEPDGWEATWFARGDRGFSPVDLGAVTVGFQICTELLFTEPARQIGQAGAQLIAAPRATGGHPRWQMGARMAAVMSGCFVASANRRSEDGKTFAGSSLLVSPDGEVLAETTADDPWLTAEIDPDEANRAKRTYPRNVVTV
jgi:N-carbamoylputrescine amidase